MLNLIKSKRTFIHLLTEILRNAKLYFDMSKYNLSYLHFEKCHRIHVFRTVNIQE